MSLTEYPQDSCTCGAVKSENRWMHAVGGCLSQQDIVDSMLPLHQRSNGGSLHRCSADASSHHWETPSNKNKQAQQVSKVAKGVSGTGICGPRGAVSVPRPSHHIERGFQFIFTVWMPCAAKIIARATGHLARFFACFGRHRTKRGRKHA